MNKRWIFVTAVAVMLTLIWVLVFSELILPLNLNRSVLLIVLGFFIFTFSLQMVRLAKFQRGYEHPKSVLITFIFFGLFVHLFCAALTKNLLMLVPAIQPYESYLSAVFILLAVIFNGKGIHTSLKGPAIKKVVVKVPEHFKKLNGTRIVQVSDLHLGPVIQNKFVKPIVEKIHKLNPDILVFTGDIGDGDAKLYAGGLNAFESVKTTYGKFYVTGNHEHIWGAHDWIQSVESCGIQPLINKGLQLNEELYLGGVPDITSHRFAFEKSVPQKAIDGAEGFKILLAHQPKSCVEAEKAGFDLMLSGHTHNGQFFPFNLLIGFFNPYSKGLNQHGKMKVYVNAGSGFWGPPLRLGVESEVTLLILSHGEGH